MALLSKFCPLLITGAVVTIALIPARAIAQDRSLWLRNNEHAMLQGYFLQGEDIYAICDSDCSDLDLFLYAENGSLVDADDALDAFPIVTAPYEGTFSLQVAMPSCRHSAGCAASISSDYGF
ncbi:MAG: hypothetical protein AAGN15_10275 [Cyanobacteria bacterium J06581_3]